MPPAPLTAYSDTNGADLVVCALCGESEARLRDVGLREGACVAVLQNSGDMIVRLAGCRLGLRRELAACVLATPRDDAK